MAVKKQAIETIVVFSTFFCKTFYQGSNENEEWIVNKKRCLTCNLLLDHGNLPSLILTLTKTYCPFGTLRGSSKLFLT